MQYVYYLFMKTLFFRYTPVGVVVCVLTWNFPLLNLGYKLGPILASGCTCVIKPSEMTPLATSMALELLGKCGFPPGVVNVVNGTGMDLLKPLCSSKVAIKFSIYNGTLTKCIIQDPEASDNNWVY